jgi:hypothetical protein
MTPRSIFSRPAGSPNYFDPETRICWHIGQQWCRDDHKNEPHFSFGRCRSGQRWFWVVHDWRATVRRGEVQDADYNQGWEDTEQLAEAAVRAAITSRANGQPAMASLSHGTASGRLKDLNKVKRAQRPPSDSTDSKRIEYLYGTGLCRFQIIKKTRRRIFYLKQGEYINQHGEPTGDLEYPSWERDYDSVGFIDRQKLEATGKVQYLYASLQDYLDEWRRGDISPPPDLRQLKAEMAAAHPDRGGSNTAFIAARERYLGALRRCSNSNSGPTK